MKCVVAVAFACSCLVLPASAQQVVKQLLPTPPKGDKLEVRLATATIEPGAVGKWHTYPNHPVVYVAQGTVTVEFRNGERKVYTAGEGFVEPINTVLRGANKGRTPVKLVIFQLSPPEVPDAMDAPSE
jgi:quercetin dioxygenase-like cupin family protein